MKWYEKYLDEGLNLAKTVIRETFPEKDHLWLIESNSFMKIFNITKSIAEDEVCFATILNRTLANMPWQGLNKMCDEVSYKRCLIELKNRGIDYKNYKEG